METDLKTLAGRFVRLESQAAELKKHEETLHGEQAGILAGPDAQDGSRARLIAVENDLRGVSIRMSGIQKAVAMVKRDLDKAAEQVIQARQGEAHSAALQLRQKTGEMRRELVGNFAKLYISALKYLPEGRLPFGANAMPNEKAVAEILAEVRAGGQELLNSAFAQEFDRLKLTRETIGNEYAEEVQKSRNLTTAARSATSALVEAALADARKAQ